MLREVCDTIEKLCDESEETKTNILQRLVFDLNELLEIPNEKVSDDLGESELSGKINESGEEESLSGEKSNDDEEEGEKTTKSADGEDVEKIAGNTENDDQTKTSVETEEVVETVEKNNSTVENDLPTTDEESKVEDENGVDPEETGNVVKIIEVEEDEVKHVANDDDDIHMNIERMNLEEILRANAKGKKRGNRHNHPNLIGFCVRW